MKSPRQHDSPTEGAIVDVCALHFDVAGWGTYLRWFANLAPGYLEKFAGRFCALAGAETARFRQLLARDAEDAVSYLIDCRGSFARTFEQYAASMEAQGVTHVVLQGCPWDGEKSPIHEYHATCVRARPDLVSAWIGLSISDSEASVRQIERGVRELGMTGATLIPCLEGVSASDPRAKPIYDRLCELDLPVWIHTGHNFNSRVPLETSHWRHIDAIASAYPTLRILAGHGGWPWVQDMVALCLRHSNVHLDISSHSPAFMPKPGSGWESLLFHAGGAMRDRVMFGTSNWVTPKLTAELAAEVRGLPISGDVSHRWLAGNAERVLRLRLQSARRAATAAAMP